MKSARTHYERLGIPHDASPVQIKHAFRGRAVKTHPDMRRGRPAEIRKACAEFAALREAYVTLSDPEQRAAYDAGLGSAPPPEPRPAQLAATHPLPVRRIVPPMSPYEHFPDHGGQYADDLERQVWGEPLAACLNRLIAVSLLFLLSGAIPIVLWIHERQQPDARHLVWKVLIDVGFSLGFLALYCVWALPVHLKRIRAAGGLVRAWRLSGGWRAVWKASPPRARVMRVRGGRSGFHLVLAGFVLGVLPCVSLGFLMSDDPQAKLPAAITLAIELPLLVWFVYRIIQHYR